MEDGLDASFNGEESKKEVGKVVCSSICLSRSELATTTQVNATLTV